MAHLGRHFRLLSRRFTIELSSLASSRCALDGGCWRSDDVMMVSMRGLSTASIRDGVVLPFEACGGDKEWSSRKGLDSKATPGLPTWMESRKFATVASSFVGKGILQSPALMIDAQTWPRGDRGFAKAVALPPQMQKPMKLRVYQGSPGVIGEPYKPPPPPLPILRRWFTKEGWQIRRQNVIAMLRTGFTLAKIRQKTKGYSQAKFYREATDLYKEINSALAQGDRSVLRNLVTDKVLTGMKKELKHREQAWASVKWELVGPIKRIRTLQGRLIGVDEKNMDTAFAQITLRIISNQKFAAYDKQGKVIAGDPEKELTVEDIWVFERQLSHPELRWRLCGRLNV